MKALPRVALPLELSAPIGLGAALALAVSPTGVTLLLVLPVLAALCNIERGRSELWAVQGRMVRLERAQGSIPAPALPTDLNPTPAVSLGPLPATGSCQPPPSARGAAPRAPRGEDGGPQAPPA